MTSKEALEVLLGYASFNERYYMHKGEDPYGVIKKDLDELEELKKVNEILINKSISKMFLQITKDVDGYNKAIKEFTNFPTITQEEYNLLRRYFYNE